MNPGCAATTLRLHHIADVENVTTPHLTRCLSCQVRRNRIRRIDRTMAGMAFTTIPAPHDLMAAVGSVVGVQAVADITTGSASGRLPDIAAGAVAVIAAGVGAVVGGAAVLVWRRAHA